MLTEIIQYYHTARRTALICQDNQTKDWYHLFSVIELLPTEIEDYKIPTPEWHNNKIIRSLHSSQSDLYSCYLIINNIPSTEEALKIFHSPNENNLIDGQKNLFFNKTFIKEPSGTVPLVGKSDEDITSILPKRTSGLYLWAQIDNERVVEKIFRSEKISSEMKAMSQLTNDWLGFDIWSKAEHIGNIYLSLPNPYFRDLDITLSQNPIGIIYNFKLRKGVKGSFKMRVIDKHGEIIALDKLFEIKDTLGIIELPHEPHLTEVRIYNSNDDLIAITGPFVFLKTVQVDMNIKTADFHVNVQGVGKNKEFVVEKFSSERSIVIGEPANFNPAIYFKIAEQNRARIELEKRVDFVFLPGGKTPQEKTNLKVKAKDTIKGILNRSRETCYLCDPYFNVNDLIEYVFSIKSIRVKIRILNAKGGSFIDKDKAKDLLDAINEYNTKPFQKIECRMLRGDSILHDRFIISDTNVWFLGSSFSEFGNRATCIGKVPESTNLQILKEIEKWYYDDNYSQAIEAYLNEVE